MVFKLQLLFDELPTLECLKYCHSDLYPPSLTCRSCITHDEDFAHLSLCQVHCFQMQRITSSLKKYLVKKITLAAVASSKNPSPFIT